MQSTLHKAKSTHNPILQELENIAAGSQWGYQPVFYFVELPVYFPCSVSSTVYEDVIRELQQKAQAGERVLVVKEPLYIDNIPSSCYYCQKQLAQQKKLFQELNIDVEIQCAGYESHAFAHQASLGGQYNKPHAWQPYSEPHAPKCGQYAPPCVHNNCHNS